jgi:hypothetical protein
MKPHVVDAPVQRCPDPQRARDWGQAFVRLNAPAELAELSRWRERLPVRRVRVPLADPAATQACSGPDVEAVLTETRRRAGVGLRVDLEVDPRGAEALDGQPLEPWWDREVTPWAVLRPGQGESVLQTARQVGAAGWPLQLEPTRELLRAELPLLDLLDHYLFAPALTAPVEPLHGLLVGLLQRRPMPLWFHWFGVPVDRFHADDQGRVSLCAAWARRASRRYGRDHEPVATWRASAAHRVLRGYRGRAHRAKRAPAVEGDPTVFTPCATCEPAHLCGGLLRALDPEARCDAWQELLQRLRIAAGTMMKRAQSAPGSGPQKRRPPSPPRE